MSCYKLVVLGELGVGKSSSVIQIIQHHFIEEYDADIEDSYRKRVVIDDEACLLEIFDSNVASEDYPYPEVGDAIIREGEGFILLFSVTSRKSFEVIRSFRSHILNIKDTDMVPMLLVGNKTDCPKEEWEISSMEARSLAAMWGCGYAEASAKLRINIEESFYEVVRIIRVVKEYNSPMPVKTKLSKFKTLLKHKTNTTEPRIRPSIQPQNKIFRTIGDLPHEISAPEIVVPPTSYHEDIVVLYSSPENLSSFYSIQPITTATKLITLLKGVDLSKESNNADVIFTCGDGKLFAHKVILASRCSFFSNMFASGMKETLSDVVNLIVKNDVIRSTHTEIFKAFLQYLYIDQVDGISSWQPDQVFELYVIANQYQVTRLEYICAYALVKMFTPNNAALTFEMLLNSPDLVAKQDVIKNGVHFVKKNKSKFSTTQFNLIPNAIKRETYHKPAYYTFNMSPIERILGKANATLFAHLFSFLEVKEIKQLKLICSWLCYTVEDEEIWLYFARHRCWNIIQEAPDIVASWSDYCVYKTYLEKNWLSDNIDTYCAGNMAGHAAAVMCLSLPPSPVFENGKAIAVSGSVDKTIKVWDVIEGKALYTLSGHTAAVTGVQLLNSSYSADVTTNEGLGCTIASCSDDTTVKLWSLLDNGKCLKEYKGFTAAAKCVSFSDTMGSSILSGGDNSIINVWDTESGELVNTLKGHSRSIWCLQTLGQQAISGSDDKTIRIWDNRAPPTRSNTHTLTGHNSFVSCVQSDFRKFVVSGGGDGTVRVWDLRATHGVGVEILDGHHGKAVMAIHKDSNTLVSGGYDNSATIWDISRNNTNPIKRISNLHTGPIRALAVNDRILLSGSYDKTISVCDFAATASEQKEKGCNIS